MAEPSIRMSNFVCVKGAYTYVGYIRASGREGNKIVDGKDRNVRMILIKYYDYY